MKWSDETFVKIYTRDTPEFLAMSWQARCLLHELVRKVDRAGVLKVGRHGLEGIALTIRAPLCEIESGLQELLREGRLIWDEAGGCFLIPNHVEAQMTPQSLLSRQRRSRDWARGTRASSRSHASHEGDAAPSTQDALPGRTEAPAEHAEPCQGVAPTAPPIPSERSADPSGPPPVKASAETDDASNSRPRLPATHTPMDAERKLSDEGRAYAETVGVTDIDRVFRDFVHHYLSEAKMSADWDAMWRRWCDRELRIQRTERERSRGPHRPPLQMDPPGAKRAWTMPPIIYPPKKDLS